MICDSHVEFIHHPEDDAKLSNLMWIKSQIDPVQVNGIKPELLFLAIFVEPGVNSWKKMLWVVNQYLQIIIENGWVLVLRKSDLSKGGIKIILHVEDLSAIKYDLARIKTLYDMGVRSVGLTHNRDNQFAGGSLTPDIGLKPFGISTITALISLGILLDYAHLNKKAIIEIYEQFKLPVFISHTGLAGVYSTPRNIDDDILALIAKSSGYVGIGFAGSFLAKSGGTIEDFFTQVEYAQKVAGSERVGIGSDLGGVASYLPNGVSAFSDIASPALMSLGGVRGLNLKHFIHQIYA